MIGELDFQCVDGLIPEMDNLPFAGSFFNSYTFLATKNFNEVKVFLAKNQMGDVYARMTWVKSEGAWVSLPGSPFGGLECHPEYDASIFLTYMIQNLAGRRLVVKLPAAHVDNRVGLFEGIGFKEAFEDINQHLDLRGAWKPHLMELRRIEKCEDAGFVCERLLPTRILIARVHSFIAQCRQENGLQINIDLAGLFHQVAQNPDHYDFFVVKHHEKIIAATITVRINDFIVYNYLPANLREYKSFSPMTLLLKNIFYAYQSKNFHLLDMGVSSIEGKKQEGLVNFKKAMGCESTLKPTLVYGAPG